MDILVIVLAALTFLQSTGVGLSSNGNMFGNFARWNEPNTPTLSMSKKSDDSSTTTRSKIMPPGPTNKLHIQVYRALMDAVVLDWTISLADKDRMKTCAVTYLSTENQEKAITIDPFMPQTRTFLLENLTPNQHYKLNMSCESDTGSRLESEVLQFSTLHMSSLLQRSPDYLSEMNLKSLPAISNSIQTSQEQTQQQNPIKVSTTNLSSSRSYYDYTRRTSPHAVLGLSCAIFGAILVFITVCLALRRYSQYKRSQTRLWELQLAQEAETPSSMPTFINLPPPYSEQPSPLYNLCASSISSNYSHLNHCCHHIQYQHLCLNPSSEEKSAENKATVEVTETEEDTNSTTDTTTSAF